MSTSLFVSKFYEMDPQFEDLLANGKDLKDGMIILLEDSMFRGDPDSTSPYEQEKVREINRWCTVSQVNIQRRFDTDELGRVIQEASPLVSFVATYGDGVKKKRSYDSSYAWIVKLESM